MVNLNPTIELQKQKAQPLPTTWRTGRVAPEGPATGRSPSIAMKYGAGFNIIHLQESNANIRKVYRGEGLTSLMLAKNFLFLILRKKILLVHFATNLLVIIFIFIQNSLEDSCFYPKKCSCKLFPARIVSAIRESVGLSVNFLTLGYYCIFIIKESYSLKFARKATLVCFFVTNFVVRLTFPNETGASIVDIAIGFMWLIGFTSIYLIFLHKLKWSFMTLVRRIKVPMTITILIYLHTKSNLALRGIQIALRDIPHGELIYLLTISAFNNAVIYLFFLGNRFYSQFIKSESKTSSPQIYYAKYVLCIVFGHQIGIFLLLEFHTVNFWVGLLAYLALILRLHTSFSVIGDTVIYLYNKVMKKPFILDCKIDLEFYRILRFQHIEILIIFISKVFIFNASKRWTYFVYENDYHIAGCNLAITDAFQKKLFNLTILACFDIVFTLLLIAFEFRSRKMESTIAVEEDLNFFSRVLVTSSLHSTMEYYIVFFYDMQT